MNKSVIEEIAKIGYYDLWNILLAYAIQLMKCKGGSVLGAQPQDIASQAIEIILVSEWNQEQGDMLGCIKKEIFKGYRRLVRKKEYTLSSNVDPYAVEVNSKDKANRPDSIVESLQGVDDIYSIIKSKTNNDADKIVEVLDAMGAGYTNKEITELLDIRINEVENYKKRIRRYLSNKKSGK